MGCSASKSVETTKAASSKDEEEGYAQLGRSMSMPVRGRDSSSKRDSHHVVALTSSTYGILKVDPPPHKQMKKGQQQQIPTSKSSTAAEEIYEKLKNFDVPAEMVAKPWSEVSLSLPKLPPVVAAAINPKYRTSAKGGEPETINMWELMDGLEDDLEGSVAFEKLKISDNMTGYPPTLSKPLEKSPTFHTIRTVEDLDSAQAAKPTTPPPSLLHDESSSTILQMTMALKPPAVATKQFPFSSVENCKSLTTQQEERQENAASQFLSSAARGILSEATAALNQERGKVFPYPPSPNAVLAKSPSTQCGPGSSMPFMAQASSALKSSAMKLENAPMIPKSLSVRPGLTGQDGSSGRPSIVHQTSSTRVDNSKAPVMQQESSRVVVSYSPGQVMSEASTVSSNVSPVPSSMHVLTMAAAFEEEAKKLSPQHLKASSPVLPRLQPASNTTVIMKGGNKPSQCFSPNVAVSNNVVNDSESGVSEIGLNLESGYVHVSEGKSLSEERKAPLKVSSVGSKQSSTTDELESTIDPDLFASFERELELFSNEEWYNVGRHDGATLSIIPGSQDEESSSKDHSFALPAGADTNGKGNKIMEVGMDGGPKAITLKTSKCSTTPVVEVKRLNPCPLECFEVKCPPAGEQRVVLYTTSLRGIRKTFEDCNHVRFILRSLGLSLDERDVSMHAEFRQELKDLVDTPVQVPRVFVKGRYIGGADEVSKLHEDGTLAVLVEGLPSQISREGCDGCGGVRFVPCLDCSGSCKVITDTNEVVRCTECNENGLMRCPICD